MNLRKQLAAQPLLTGMPDAMLDAIAGCAQSRHFAAGETLLRQNAEIHDFYLLVSGRVALQCDTQQSVALPLQTLGPGEAIGWSWLIPPYQSFFDATATEPVDVIAIDCAALRDAMEADNALGYALLKRVLKPMLSRLQACRLQLMDVYGQPDQAVAP